MTIYESNDATEPDSAFEAGTLEFLMVGNEGRLLDARRTPIALTGIDPAVGMFELELLAFEDAGARWRLPFEEVTRFQFRRDATRVGSAEHAEHARAVVRFDRRLHIACDPAARHRSMTQIDEFSRDARDHLRPCFSGELDLDARDGDPNLFHALDTWMHHHAVTDIEQELATTFVSNPNSGERIKGHGIVLAELGLCPYDGKIVRSTTECSGAWSRDRRARHIICRLAFVRAVFALAGRSEVTVHRGLASDGSIDLTRTRSFVSATFSREVAEAHFHGGSDTVTAALLRHRVTVERLWMTFFETRAMNIGYHEAEAVLIGDPGNRLF